MAGRRAAEAGARRGAAPPSESYSPKNEACSVVTARVGSGVNQPNRMKRGPKSDGGWNAATAVGRPWWRNDWLSGAALMALTVLAYQGVRHAGFIWDDDMHVTANPVVVGPLGWTEIWTSRAARYFPLTLTTFRIEHALWGLDPVAYHAVNVLLHGACAVILWRVLRGLRVWGAWMGAALWALHPVQVETVAWVTELKNTQSCLFYLVCAGFFLRWLAASSGEATGRRRWSYGLMLVSGAMAMASKSSTVVLPVVLCLCAWWMEGRWRWRRAGALSPLFLMAALSGALSLWTQNLEGAQGGVWVRSLGERVAVAGNVIWFYLGKLLWPHPLVFIYPRWSVDGGHVASYVPVAAAGAVLASLWWCRKGRLKPVFFAFAYFLAALAPVLGLLDQFFWRYSFVGDHFQYLASMGPLALAGAGLEALLGRLPAAGSVLKPLGAAALLTSLGLITLRQGPKYDSSEALWRDTLSANPAAWMAHNNLGAELLRRGQVAEAVGHFRKSLEIEPRNLFAEINLGDGLLQLGRTEEAIAHDTEALKMDPGNVAARSNLGAALLQAGRTGEAIVQFKGAAEEAPQFAKARIGLGTAYLQAGRSDEAVEEFTQALASDPDDYATLTNLGAALAQRGRLEPAEAAFQKALRIAPTFATARTDLGNVRMQEGRLDEAIAEYEAALKADPRSAVTHNNIAFAFLQKRRFDQAIAHYEAALALNPDYPEARRNLKTARSEKQRADSVFFDPPDRLR
jgi:protein O-mannosyl-transferase